MKHRSVYFVVFLSVMALIMTTCAPLIPTPSATPTVVPPTPITFTEKIDVGGYKLRIRCSGQGSPTVIIEAGIGDPAVETSTWKAVTSAIAQTTQICLYDRAGVGLSDGAPGQDQSIRTSQDIVKELHALLINALVSGPYVLVGQSIGGYHVRVYAGQYPIEVVGMVLVDSVHPDQWLRIISVLPPEAPDEPASLKWIRSDIDPSANPERLDVLASGDQVRAAGSLGDLPLVVLTHKLGWSIDPNLPPDLSAKIDRIWQDLQVDLAGLSSNSTHIIATEAGHDIPVDEPQLVIDAILNVMAQTKK